MSNQLLLKIANFYANVDIRNGLPKRYVHVSGKRLQPLCRKLGIKYADALIGFTGSKRRGYKPETDGVIVSKISAPKLLDEIEARTKRNPSAKRESNKRNRQQREQKQREAERQELANLGIDPYGMVANWYQQGEIDRFEAQLISFKTAYRHKFTDYEDRLERCMQQAQAIIEKKNLRGEHRQFEREMAHDDARSSKIEDSIPDNWADYLAKYPFPYEMVAKHVAEVLEEPTKAHPVWFCEACIAVFWSDIDLNALTYKQITEAIHDWRCSRSQM
ncbi:MAG: hypothetical protein CME33_04310 [Gimesia sp.]|uniref:hypothetical protein n=1 Tax=Gimesia sp. TaxID=2024833 RepID=UPI000C6B80EB|nr:hypothetical protein [Gimesia sp.]MAX35776.1 hypothetical protein [Gimesia sp.]|tara:strand:+ start:1433 stop:2257 length:825 start_codon:yes stop_codon:yes gene_type:complete